MTTTERPEGAPSAAPAPPSAPRRSLGRLFGALGVDRAIAYTIAQRAFTILSAPLTLGLIASRLSPDEQGFYYTFASVLGVQQLFELGLSYVLLQFASHEMADLQWTPAGTLAGDATAKARLASLLRVVLFWYAVVALVVVLVVLPGGMAFFSRNAATLATHVPWRWPWAWVVVVSALTLFLGPLFSVLEGCGKVAEVARQRTLQSIVGNIALWGTLLAHWGLFASPFFSTASLLAAVGWVVWSKGRFLVDLLGTRKEGVRVDWGKEVWPFQWRIAISTLSGYFIFQMYNPILFATHGAEAAGRMGMSATVMGAISGTALAWVSTKSAPFGALIARRQYLELDALFFRALKQSVVAIVGAGACFFVGTLLLRYVGSRYATRLLDPAPLALLILTAISNHLLTCEAIYLRAHKREPFLWLSVALAIVVAGSSYLLARPFAALGMMAGSFASNLVVGLGVGTWIFVTRRKAWHAEPATPEGPIDRQLSAAP